MKILKCLLMIVTAPVVLVLTLFVWLCTGLIYISGLVLGLLSTVIALLGVAVLITYSPQNGVILLVMAFLISPMGLPLAAIWLLGKVQSLKFCVCNISCYIINFKPEFDVLFGKVTGQFPHSNFYSPTDEIIRVSCWSFSNFFVFKVYWCFNSIPGFFFPCVTYSTSCFCFCHYINLL